MHPLLSSAYSRKSGMGYFAKDKAKGAESEFESVDSEPRAYSKADTVPPLFPQNLSVGTSLD
jgi:hypothetical protein